MVRCLTQLQKFQELLQTKWCLFLSINPPRWVKILVALMSSKGKVTLQLNNECLVPLSIFQRWKQLFCTENSKEAFSKKVNRRMLFPRIPQICLVNPKESPLSMFHFSGVQRDSGWRSSVQAASSYQLGPQREHRLRTVSFKHLLSLLTASWDSPKVHSDPKTYATPAQSLSVTKAVI